MKIPQELEKFGLTYAKREVKRRLICTSEGSPGVGKTDLFYRTAPRPALVLQLDLNDEGIRENYEDDTDIVFKNIVVPPYVKHDEAQRVKDYALYKEQFRDLIVPSIVKEYFRSIMIDEGAEWYTLVRRSFLVDLGFGGEKQTAYVPVNAAMKRIYTLAKQHRVNLYVPHRQVDERNAEGTGPSGNKKAGGWKSTLFESQCHIVLDKDASFNAKACGDCGKLRDKCRCDKFIKQSIADKFTATVTKCTARTAAEGAVLRGTDISWQTLGQLVFPHSSPEEWD